MAKFTDTRQKYLVTAKFIAVENLYPDDDAEVKNDVEVSVKYDLKTSIEDAFDVLGEVEIVLIPVASE